MKLFALSLLASASYAANWQQQPVQNWQQPQTQSWQQPKTQSWQQPKTQSWQQPQTQSWAPMPAPAPAPAPKQQYMVVQKPPAVYGRDYNYTAHDPFRNQGTRIPYVPAKINKAVYAQCMDPEITHLRLFMGQLPGHAIELKGQMESDDVAGQEIKFRLTQWGRWDSLEGGEGEPERCTELGATFNPLANEEYLDTETRGTIEPVTIPDTISVPYKVRFKRPLKQNLGGPNSIIGRGVEMITEETDDQDVTTVTKSCCAVVLMKPPAPDPAAPPSYLPHYHPAQYYTYGHGQSNGAKAW